MDKVIWNERLNIGVEVIDTAHANLFRVVGKLMHLVENEANYKNSCKEGIRYLEDYTVKHFSEEETYMRSIHYPGYVKHKEIHDTFRDQTLVSLKKALELSHYSQSAAEHFLSILLGWLTGHIMTEGLAVWFFCHAEYEGGKGSFFADSGTIPSIYEPVGKVGSPIQNQ